MKLARDLRLIPVVAIAAAALFLLKASALLLEGGYTLIASRTAQAQGLGSAAESAAAASAPLAPTAPAAATDEGPAAPRGDRSRIDRSRSWVSELYPRDGESSDVTGSVAAPKPDPQPAAEKTEAPPAEALKPQMSAGERAVLESLQARRQELEARARDIEVRDSLLKAAEKRIEQRLLELKELETRVTGAAAKKAEDDSAKFKSLVTMYENMKAKDAAKVFDRLNLSILVEVVNAMNPRRMSDILGQMAPEAAERLTIEIANRSGAVNKPSQPAELPKIEGRPKT